MSVGHRMAADIVIPTCKSRADVRALIEEVERTARGHPRIIATCQPASAAANRNLGLERVQTPLLIMIDDDVIGFPRGWNAALTSVLAERPECVAVSARLTRPDGGFGQMLGGGSVPTDGGVHESPRRELPTACLALRNDGTRFDEGYVGSGWEDTDFSARLRGIYPDGVFVIHDGVRIVHANEQKHQGDNFKRNMRRYQATWGAPIGNYV